MSLPAAVRSGPVSFAILALALLAAACDAPAPSTAMPRDSIIARLADLRAIHTPEGVEVLEPIEVNGSTQWISIRGLNRANPILLVLHGGPGSPVMGMAWAYQKPWEDFFTVVNWDRRGVGKSFAAADSARLAPTLTLQQHVDDALVVVEHLLARFGQEKLVVLGYSYGSSIGPRLIDQHPDRFHAYVGLGQSGGPGSEAQLYSTLMERVREANDTVAIRELEALQPYPPPPGTGAVAKLLAARKWAREYDGGWYGKPTFDLYFALPEWGPEYTGDEVASLLPAMAWAERHLIDAPAGIPAERDGGTLRSPGGHAPRPLRPAHTVRERPRLLQPHRRPPQTVRDLRTQLTHDHVRRAGPNADDPGERGAAAGGRSPGVRGELDIF